jgi:mannose-6-phosphate isomerase-like protein (cupin superfamily)
MTIPDCVSISLPGEGQSLDPNGGLVCKLPAKATGGAYSVLELVLPPGGGTPRHVHHREDEVLTVVEGECEIVDGAGPRTALAGSVVRLPRHATHALRNTSQTPCRLVITAIPGGLEQFFEAVNLAVAAGEGTPERLAEVARLFEIEFLS